jgi:Putative auto-transporter adhesin, head GIN domain
MIKTFNELRFDTVHVTIPAPVTTLVVNDDITVILTNESRKEITVAVAEEQSVPVQVELESGTLRLSRKKYSTSSPLVVYVPSANLRSVHMNGTGLLSGDGVIGLKKLYVHINNECTINLKTIGKINIISWDDFEFRNGQRNTK